jgi:hypothetical protein
MKEQRMEGAGREVYPGKEADQEPIMTSGDRTDQRAWDCSLIQDPDHILCGSFLATWRDAAPGVILPWIDVIPNLLESRRWETTSE